MTSRIAKTTIAKMKRTNRYGYWTGTYDLRPLDEWTGWGLWKTRLYLFENDLIKPLTYHHPDGYTMRPDKKFKTDMGSVPLFLQSLIPVIFAKDKWLKAYILHDSAFCHKGLWFAKHDPRRYSFCEMKEKAVDDLLVLWIHASGGSCLSSAPIWLGVRIGGRFSFGKGDKRKVA